MKTLKLIAATSLGIAAGAVIGVLTAPRSGKKTRKMISSEVDSQVNAVKKSTDKQIKELKKDYNKALKKYSQSGKELISRTKEAVSLN
ncbi:YtxH domain-containing protein [Fulvivirga sp.]|uniref:YtxH domain-containing protein n=1 Tax=Fulvivirga sp. TaxID=1931237 RepID=UPI0032F04C85